ncbi:MAG: TonB-dependent receptor [Sphingomonadales bacterium]|nr:TonB-dependent receptor [Sphingomonadales bacterium]
MINIRPALLALFATTCLATPAFAEEAPDGTIVVTAARGTALKDMDVSATVITAREVEMSPATATDQLVNRIPGVFTLNQPAAVLHPTGDTFSIRGFGTTTNVNTLVMVDGIPANDAFFRVVDWNQVAKSQIGSIEVIRGGGATSLWGNMAMGGIVNILTRAPEAEHMDFDASVGSFRTLSGTATAGLALGGDVVAGLTVSDTTSAGYNKTPEAYRNPAMAATSSNNLNIQGSVRAATGADSSLFLTASWHRLQENNLVWTLTQNRWQTWRVAFGGEKRVGGGRLALTGWVGGGLMNTTNVSQTPGFSIFNPAVGVPYVSQTENATYHSLGGSLVWQASLGVLKDIKLGVDGRSLSASDPLNLFATTGATGNLLAKAKHHFEGVFAQATLAPGAFPLEVTIGLRGDFWQTADGSLSGNYRGTVLASAIADQSISRFDPRIGMKLALGRGLSLRGAAYSNFAAPGMNQMVRSFIGGTSYTTFNPDLKPQTNLGGEIGLDFNAQGALGEISLQASAYANTLRNFIDFATVQSGCAAANNYCGTGIVGINGGRLNQYVNAGDAVLRGFEVLGSWRRGRLSAQGGFTYTDAHLTHSLYAAASNGVIPDPVGQQLGQVPEWTLTASAAWRASDALQFNVAVKSFPAYWASTSHVQRNDGATIVDLGAAWEVRPGLTLYTSLQNVGNNRFLDQGLGLTATNGSIVSGSTVPARGMPFWATFGIRAHI